MEEDVNNTQVPPTETAPKPSERSKKLLSIVVIALLLVIALVAYTLKGPESQPPAQTTNQQEQDASLEVVIAKDGFVPASLKINKGDTVTWVNQDDVPHLVASNPHPEHTGLPGFDAKDAIVPGATYSHTFDEAGTFTYHDHLNPIVNGTIIVE